MTLKFTDLGRWDSTDKKLSFYYSALIDSYMWEFLVYLVRPATTYDVTRCMISFGFADDCEILKAAGGLRRGFGGGG
jgi:hypothetical protein